MKTTSDLSKASKREEERPKTMVSKNDGSKKPLSDMVKAIKLYREKGKAAIPELKRMKKENPALDLESIFHKANQQKIITQGKKLKEAQKDASRVSSVSEQEMLFDAVEREALGQLIRKEWNKAEIASEALSIMTAAMLNNTKLVKAHFTAVENTIEAVKEKANSTDNLGRTPLFYAVFYSNTL
jgi:ankyrin repeat protein